jgi:hypothetical protein
MIHFVSLLLPALLATQQASVAQCNADPTGKKDSTSAFAKCLEAMPAGDLLVPSGEYKISGTITKTRNQNLIGMGPKASVLKCESTTSPCIVAADSSAGFNNYSVSRIENIGIEGPGPGNASVGIYLGGDPNEKSSSKNAFADSVNLIGIRVAGFNHGIEWGNNAYVNKIVRSLVLENNVGLYAPAGLKNSGEAIGITDSEVFNNKSSGIEDHSNFEWMIQGASFDYNKTAILFYGSTIHAVNCHFEQNQGQVFFQPWGVASLSIRDSEILIQAATGDDKYILSTWPQALNLVIDNVSIWSNHPVHYFMRMQGTVTGAVTNLHGNGNRKIGAFSDDLAKSFLKPSHAF